MKKYKRLIKEDVIEDCLSTFENRNVYVELQLLHIRQSDPVCLIEGKLSINYRENSLEVISPSHDAFVIKIDSILDCKWIGRNAFSFQPQNGVEVTVRG